MEQIPVTAKKPRPKAWDSALLVGASLLVAAAGVGAFLVFDDHPEYVFAVCSGAVFIAAVGPSFRMKLGSPAVWVFLTVWLVLHVAIYLLTLA